MYRDELGVGVDMVDVDVAVDVAGIFNPKPKPCRGTDSETCGCSGTRALRRQKSTAFPLLSPSRLLRSFSTNYALVPHTQLPAVERTHRLVTCSSFLVDITSLGLQHGRLGVYYMDARRSVSARLAIKSALTRVCAGPVRQRQARHRLGTG